MEISSADGWNKVSFVPKSRFPANPQWFFLAELVITGRFWDRERALFPESTLELTDDFQVELRQVVVPAERMKELAGYLERWLSDFSEFEIRLSEEGEATVVVVVGVRADFISKPERPVFTLRYTTSRMRAEWCFVTDPSCVSGFLEGVRGWLDAG